MFKIVFPRLLIPVEGVEIKVKEWIRKSFVKNQKVSFIKPSKHARMQFIFEDITRTIIMKGGTKIGIMDFYCHAFLPDWHGGEFIHEGIDWGIKPNIIQWLLAGINGEQNIIRFAKAIGEAGKIYPPSEELQALIKESNAAVDCNAMVNPFTIQEMLDAQLLRYNTCMEYL